MLRRLLILCATAALATPALAHAAPAPVAWCGHDETADHALTVEVSSPDQISVVYATPSDGADNFLAEASGIATDAAAIDAWWRGQDSARTPRFDLYPFPGCGSYFGSLDIQFVRLPHPGSYYTAVESPAELLDTDLAAGISPPSTHKTLVYFDGPIGNGRICGQTDYQPLTTGGRFGFVYVFLQSGCDLGAPGGGATATVGAHELLHNLGAVPVGAPHGCPGDPAHVCDNTLDIMDPFLGDGESLDTDSLDFGRDDYYGHSGSQWDVQDSGWLIRLPQQRLQLAIEGPGALATNLPLLECAHGCTAQLDNGLELQVAPEADTRAVFVGWSGDCSGTGPCVLRTDGPKSATAVFAATVALRVSVAGRGRVVSAPAGISCPGRCAGVFRSGAALRLTARPAAGYRFTGWSGACRGRGACSLRPAAASSVRARFTRR